jgi:predicted transposase YbfD/YdcC
MTSEQGFGTILAHFGDIDDPRVDRTKQHELLDIIGITICAVICGADDWVEIEDFGNAKHSWLKRFLSLPNGIPSHDTFGRVFSMLAPDEFGESFLSWVRAVSELTEGQVIAIDGKSLRRSHDRANGKSALHMVSAWASENHLVLGQTKTDEKSNEITAIPELLNILELKSCIVTIDAMGCQKDIAKQIVDAEAEYVLAVKSNQGRLFENIKDVFECAERDGFEDVAHSYHEQISKGHGRLEERRCWVITDPKQLAYVDEAGQWCALKSIVLVRYNRDDDKPQKSRYYICSLKVHAKKLLSVIREHLGIENGLHWVLDMAFDEDHSRVRAGHADHNLAVVRHMTLNMLKQEKTAKVGIKAKRKRAGWDEDYLLKVLSL